jgi:hypothetical protein
MTHEPVLFEDALMLEPQILIAHQAFLVVNGQGIAHGSPDELAYGADEEARTCLAASGIAPERVSRVTGEKHDQEKVIRYRNNATE